jgi:hypothetical protein
MTDQRLADFGGSVLSALRRGMTLTWPSDSM